MFNKPISMTPWELLTWIFCGILTLSVALEKLSKLFDMVIGIINKIRRPNQVQDENIETNAEDIKQHAEFLKKDNERLNQLESWVNVNDKLIREHDRKLAEHECLMSRFQMAQEVQMEALLAILQALGKSMPDDKGIADAQSGILKFLSRTKIGGRDE
jgi:uncharacterized coiled-coil protein SlyX